VLTISNLAYNIYTVSQKMSHLWLGITLTREGILIFLAEMLPIKSVIKRHFTMPPQVTCTSALPGKQFVSDIALFVLKRDVKLQLTNLANRETPNSNAVVVHFPNSTSCCLISSIFLTYDSCCCMTP